MRGEFDGQVGVQGAGQAPKERDGRHGSAALDAGDLGLLHAAALGERGLRQAERGAPVVDELTEIVGQLGLLVEPVVLGVLLDRFTEERTVAAGLPLGAVRRSSSLTGRL